MPRRKLTQSEIVYRSLNPNGDPFDYAPEIDKSLDIIGLVLWATEGDKTQLSLANGNPKIIASYLNFLRKVCGFKEEKIRGVIHCHDTLPYSRCLSYWSKITNIPSNRFRKPYVKKDKGGQRKYPYGIMRIVASNIKLVRIFNERLRDLSL